MRRPKSSIFLALAALCTAGWAAGADDPPAASRVAPSPAVAPVLIPGAEQFELRSRDGLDYRIFVAAPAGEAATGHPVIYLTDANGNFPTLLAAARGRSGDGPRAVVVGIGYPGDDAAVHRRRRARDLTPPMTPAAIAAAAASGLPGAAYAAEAGGADRFLEFIQDDLKPVIERKYRIDRSRQALFGHSFGGLFTLHALFRRPEAFGTYLASSPSTYWDDGVLFREAEGFLVQHARQGVAARLLISTGARERIPGRATPAPLNPAPRRPAAGTARDLADRLSAAQTPGLAVSFREFAEEDHGTVVLPAASRGVRFAIDGE